MAKVHKIGMIGTERDVGDPLNLQGVTITKTYKIAKGGEGNRAWTRIDGHVEDETGEIKFNWWRPPLDSSDGLNGATVNINGTVDEYDGNLRIRVAGEGMQSVGGCSEPAKSTPASGKLKDTELMNDFHSYFGTAFKIIQRFAQPDSEAAVIEAAKSVAISILIARTRGDVVRDVFDPEAPPEPIQNEPEGPPDDSDIPF